MSESSLANVGEMIDSAFGDIDRNVVNFKLLQAVLMILASRLKILERRFLVELDQPFETSSTMLWVTEVKVHAKMPKKKKKMTKTYSVADPQNVPHGMKIKQKHKQIERPIGKTLTHTYYASVTKQTYFESRVTKQPASKPGYKLYPDKRAADKSSSEMSEKSSSSSRLNVKRQTSKIPTKEKPKESFAFEWASAKHELKFGEHIVEEQQEDLSDLSSTDTLLPTSMSSEKTKTVVYKSSGSSMSMKKETKVTINLPETDEFSKSPLLTWDKTGEILHENLIIVQRVSVDDTEDSESYTSDESNLRYRPSSIVTQDQFERLVKSVIELQKLYGDVRIPGITDNPEFMNILRKSASMSQGAAGIQLSARLEMAELTLEKLMQLLTLLYNQLQKDGGKGGRDLPALQDLENDDEDSWQSGSYDAQSVESRAIPVPSLARAEDRDSRAPSMASRSRKSQRPIVPQSIKQVTAKSQQPMNIDPTVDTSEWVTYEELDVAMTEVYEEYTKKIANTAHQCHKTSDGALKQIRGIDVEVTKALEELDGRMINVEKIVIEYADKVNDIDMNLTTQMTSYQDELTQMQHDLENGLDRMAEAIANQTSDVEAITDTNTKFNHFQTDIDSALALQKDLNEVQAMTSMEIQGLVKDISDLKETKSDREEVAEALSDKADISALNGMVYLYQFNAVQGDMEKRIVSAYDKINSTELTWQKAINELTREFLDRAEKIQVEALRSDVNNNLQKLRGRLQFMCDILGELKPHNIIKDILHKEACLSCDTPGMEEPILNPIIPAFPTSKPSEKPGQFGDHGICYPGMLIPHPRDPRLHVPTCPNYCGGPPNKIPRESDTELFHRAIRDPIGAGDEVSVTYNTKQKPCIPCNRPSRPSEQMSPTKHQSMEEIEEESEVAFGKCPWYCPCQYDEQNQPPAPPMD